MGVPKIGDPDIAPQIVGSFFIIRIPNKGTPYFRKLPYSVQSTAPLPLHVPLQALLLIELVVLPVVIEELLQGSSRQYGFRVWSCGIGVFGSEKSCSVVWTLRSWAREHHGSQHVGYMCLPFLHLGLGSWEGFP